MTSVNPRVLMLGLDGMTYSVMEPAFDAGHMPNLRALMERSAAGVLTSTVPPYTPPGWTSIFTGVNPGRHGIFGFTLGNRQQPGGLVRLDKVKAPAIWNAANHQGARMGVFNVPMTYPAPVLDGWSVSGMLTPEGGGTTPDNFTHPVELSEEITAKVGEYRIDIDVDYDNDWKSTDIIERLSRNLALKRKTLQLLLESDGDLPILFAVLEAPDRLMHVHYKYLDPRLEHFRREEAAPIRDRAWRFFDEMDEMIGDLVAWAGSDGYVVTMSDHGFGPKHKTVNVNVALREWGLLSVGGAGAVTKSAGVRKLARRAKRVLPKSVWRRAKSAAQGSIDWSRTRAFSAPIPQQGVYVNLKGREPNGIVSRSHYDDVRNEVIAGFESLVDPSDGENVTDHIHRREDVVWGPEAERAPDLFPVCRGYSYELSDGLYSPGILDDYRAQPRGFHQMDGIFGVAGPGIGAADGLVARIYDIAPTALYLAGLKIPEMDGRVIPEAVSADRAVETEAMDLPPAGEGSSAGAYSPEEEAQIEESLRNLGYL